MVVFILKCTANVLIPLPLLDPNEGSCYHRRVYAPCKRLDVLCHLKSSFYYTRHSHTPFTVTIPKAVESERRVTSQLPQKSHSSLGSWLEFGVCRFTALLFSSFPYLADVCPMFRCVSTWHQLGSPHEIELIEIGPGKGTLMRVPSLFTFDDVAFEHRLHFFHPLLCSEGHGPDV